MQAISNLTVRIEGNLIAIDDITSWPTGSGSDFNGEFFFLSLRCFFVLYLFLIICFLVFFLLISLFFRFLIRFYQIRAM
jgi:hypothetical protein